MQTLGSPGGTLSVISLGLRAESHVKIDVFLCLFVVYLSELATDPNEKMCIKFWCKEFFCLSNNR